MTAAGCSSPTDAELSAVAGYVEPQSTIISASGLVGAPFVGSDQIVYGVDGVPSAFTLSAGIDPEGELLSYTSVTSPGVGAVTNCMNLAGSTDSGDRTCLFTPPAIWSGTTTFTYKVNDGTFDSTTNATVTIIYSPVNHAPVLTAITDKVVTAGSAIASFNVNTDQGTDYDADGQAILYTCTFAGGGFAAGTDCSSLPGTFNLNAASGAVTWMTAYASAVDNAQTVYTVIITGSDQYSIPLTDSKTFTVTVNPAAPVLTDLADRLYPSNNLVQGVAYSFDANNIRAGSPGNDTGITYACTFDRVVDGAVAAGSNCSTLAGAAFNTTTGVLSWTPDATIIGIYEIRFRGTNLAAQTADEVIVVDVRLNFAGITSVTSITTTSLVLNWSTNAAATGYEVYTVAGDGSLVPNQTIVGSGTVTATVSGLTPSTTYTFRVRAKDSLGNTDGNTVNATPTTKDLGLLQVIDPLAAVENSTGNTANLDCSDAYSSSPVYSITNQTDATVTCSISSAPEKVTCTPAFHTGHSVWTSDVTVQCVLNGSTLATRTFTVTVADTNQAPQLALNPATPQVAAAGLAMPTINSYDSNTANDTDRDGDTITYSCTFEGGGFAAGTACASLPNISYSLNTSTGVLNWTPSVAAAVGGVPTDYTFTISGSDGQGVPLSGTAAITVTVNPSVQLTAITSKTFPSTYADQGVAVNYDVNNIADGGGGNDTNMSYTCYYDQEVDGAVAAVNLCTALPSDGTPTFSTVTGALAWTPGSTAYGSYELKFTGTNINTVSDSKIVTVNVRSPYVSSNLLAYWDAQFANGTSHVTNSTSIKDVLFAATTNDGVLNNFSQTVSSGWTGNAARSISSATDGPFRLVMDGVDDHLSFPVGLNSNADMMVDGWVRPTAATAGAVILSNADSTKGIRIKQAYDGSGRVQAQIGLTNYDDVVVADAPKVYWRLNEPIGTSGADSVKDSSGNNYTGTPENPTATAFGNPIYSQAGSGMTTYNPQTSGVNSRFNNIYGATSTLLDGKTTASMELWQWNPSVGLNYGLIYWGDPANPANDFMVAQSLTAINVYVGGSGNYCSAGTSFVGSTWHHIVITYDGSQAATLCARVKVYVNGVSKALVMTGTIPASIPNNAGAAQVRAGYALTGGKDNSGRMSEVAVYDYVLSPAQVSAHYAAKMNGCISNQALNLSDWNHFSSWYDATNGIFSFAVNGQTACLVNNTYTYSGSATPLTVGGDAAANPWAGEIGDLRLYSGSTSHKNALSNYYNTGYRYGRPKEQFITDGQVLHLDAATAKDSMGPQTASTCANTKWRGTSSLPGFLGNLVNFLSSDCIADTDGWAGNGTTASPYRLEFDGVNDRLDFHSDITVANDFTMTAWVRRSSTANLLYTFGQKAGSSYYFYASAGNPTTLGFSNSGAPSLSTATTNINANTWYHLTLVRSMTQTTATCLTAPCIFFYVNGVQLGDAKADPVAGISFVTNNIGARSTSYLAGSMVAAALYNRALSPAEILTLCNTMSSRFPSGQACAP
jgi:hypothetical protein